LVGHRFFSSSSCVGVRILVQCRFRNSFDVVCGELRKTTTMKLRLTLQKQNCKIFTKLSAADEDSTTITVGLTPARSASIINSNKNKAQNCMVVIKVKKISMEDEGENEGRQVGRVTQEEHFFRSGV
jgi:hypothetical protein